jgi:hypothetical protein
VNADSTDTFTNKSISGSTNTLSNIGNSSLTNSSMNIAGHSISLGGTQAISCADLSDDGPGCSGAAGGLTLGTDTAVTSGSAVSIATGLPSTIKQLTIAARDIQTSNSSAQIGFRLGDATTGGFITTGYVGGLSATTATAWSAQAGAWLSSNGSQVINPIATITLVNSASHIYSIAIITGVNSAVAGSVASGFVTLAGALDRVEIFTSAGSFNNASGSANVAY